MDPNDRDNLVLCPNCHRIFAMTYLPSHKCPSCGTMFFPRDTMAGYPLKNIEAQQEYAEELRNNLKRR